MLYMKECFKDKILQIGIRGENKVGMAGICYKQIIISQPQDHDPHEEF